jgi:hypothetical protein
MATPSWIQPADPLGSFTAGADLGLQFQQARQRRQQLSMTNEFRQQQAENATARLLELQQHNQAMDQARFEANRIREELGKAQDALKEAKTKQEADEWKQRVDHWSEQLDQNEEKIQNLDAYRNRRFGLDETKEKDLQTNRAATLDLGNRRLDQASDIASDRNATSMATANLRNGPSYNALFTGLMKENDAQTDPKKLKTPEQIGDEAMDDWQRLRSKSPSVALLDNPAGATAPPMATPTPATGKTRVRDKTTGRTFIYTGNPADIPKDKYDVLGEPPQPSPPSQDQSGIP